MNGNNYCCRSCGESNLDLILALGETPLANSLLTGEQLDQIEMKYPLNLMFCPKCALVQIDETVPPEILFRDYLYFSSFSDTMLRHAESLVERLVPELGLGSNSLAMEIASNDGYLLQYYAQKGIPVLGIEPARNIALVAEENGVRTVCEFFSLELAQQLAEQGERADVIHANNVLAHIAGLNGVVAGFAAIIKDNGIVVSESPYIKDFIDNVEFDTIYHEHLCYYSLTALDNLFSRHGLVIFDAERIPIHGGSMRIFACRDGVREKSERVMQLLREEMEWGVDRLEFYNEFRGRVQMLKESLLALLSEKKAEGKSIAVYGASAKGSTLLNYFGISGNTLDFCVDRSTVKQGHYTPGTHLPIYSPEKLLEVMPDFVLLLTWNFADEILGQQAEYRNRGGKFIIPIPEVKVV